MRCQLASTFAAMALSGCYGPNTVPCPNGVLCGEGNACTGFEPESNKPLCGPASEVDQCKDADRALCTRASGEPGLCIDSICTPCDPVISECRFASWTAMGVSPAADLASVWMEGPKRAFAGGSSGKIIGYDGERWETVLEIPGATDVNGVWSGGGALYSVNSDGKVYRNGDIASTNPIVDPVNDPPIPLRRIWGASATDIVLVGNNDTYAEWKGTSWAWSTTGSESYEDVYGDGDLVVVVGTAGVLRRRVQNVWTTLQPAPNGDDLLGVWAASSDDIFAAGRLASDSTVGVIHRYVNGAWTTPPLPAGTPKLNGIWGASATEVYAVGEAGAILTFNGDEWLRTSVPTFRLEDISGSGRDAIAVGADGSIWRIAPSKL